MPAAAIIMRQDKGPAVRLGATPVEIRPNGSRVYEGTAAFGDVTAAYPDLDPPRVEYRPADEVMSPEALASLEGLILTGGPRIREWDGSISLPAEHAEDLLTPENSVDAIEGSVIRGWREDPPDGGPPMLRVRVIAHTAPLIKLIESGTVELSLGYMAREDKTSGVHLGVKYDRVQRGHIYNHLNLVTHARSRTPDGRAARLDKSPGLPAYPHPASETSRMDETTTTTKIDAPELSAEDAALLKQMSPEAQAMFGGGAPMPAAEDETPAEEMVEEAAEVAGDEAQDAETIAPVLAAIKAIEERLAALEGSAPKADAPPMPAAAEPTAAKKDAAMKTPAASILSNPDAVIAAATAAASKAGVESFNKSAAFVAVVRNDGHAAATTDDAATVMLSVIKSHLPGLADMAASDIKQGRMDSLTTLYKQAEELRRAGLMRKQEEALGAVYQDSGAALITASDDGILRFE